MRRSVSQILSDEQGEYEWRKRDCITTALSLYINLSTQFRMVVVEKSIEYHKMSEKDAWIRLLKNGGPLKYYAELFGDTAETVDTFAPGNLVFYDQPIRICGYDFKSSKGREAMGFVDESYQKLHWTPMGLKPIDSTMKPVHILEFV